MAVRRALVLWVVAILIPAAHAQVRGDFDDSGTVGPEDVFFFIEQWRAARRNAAWDRRCDLYPPTSVDGKLSQSDAREMLELLLGGTTESPVKPDLVSTATRTRWRDAYGAANPTQAFDSFLDYLGGLPDVGAAGGDSTLFTAWARDREGLLYVYGVGRPQGPAASGNRAEASASLAPRLPAAPSPAQAVTPAASSSVLVPQGQAALFWGFTGPGYTDTREDLRVMLTTLGYSCHKLLSTVSTLRGLSSYKVIVFEGHGEIIHDEEGAIPDFAIVSTVHPVNDFITREYFEEWQADRLAPMIVTVPRSGADQDILCVGATESFFEHYGAGRDSLVFMNCCNGLRNNLLADAVLGSGAACYLGWNDYVWDGGAAAAVRHFFDLLCQSNRILDRTRPFRAMTSAEALYYMQNCHSSDLTHVEWNKGGHTYRAQLAARYRTGVSNAGLRPNISMDLIATPTMWMVGGFAGPERGALLLAGNPIEATTWEVGGVIFPKPASGTGLIRIRGANGTTSNAVHLSRYTGRLSGTVDHELFDGTVSVVGSTRSLAGVYTSLVNWPFLPRGLQLDFQEDSRPTIAWDVRGDVTRADYRYITDAEGSRAMNPPQSEYWMVSQGPAALDRINVFLGWSVDIPVREISLRTGTERMVNYAIGVALPGSQSLSCTYNPETGRATGIATLEVTRPGHTMRLAFDTLEPNPAVDLSLPR